jgi:hypothetical protein
VNCTESYDGRGVCSLLICTYLSYSCLTMTLVVRRIVPYFPTSFPVLPHIKWTVPVAPSENACRIHWHEALANNAPERYLAAQTTWNILFNMACDMAVLITAASGHIGPRTLVFLLQHGYQAKVVLRKTVQSRRVPQQCCHQGAGCGA